MLLPCMAGYLWSGWSSMHGKKWYSRTVHVRPPLHNGLILLADSLYIASCLNLSTKATSLSPKGGHFGRVQRRWNGEYDFVHIRRKMADMGKFANWSKRLKQFVVVSVCICGNVFPLYSNLRSGSIFVSLWKLHEKHSNWAWSQVTFILDVDVGRLSRLACE